MIFAESMSWPDCVSLCVFCVCVAAAFAAYGGNK